MRERKFTVGTDVDEDLFASIENIILEEHEKLSPIIPKEKLKNAFNKATYLKQLIIKDIARRHRIRKSNNLKSKRNQS